MPTILLIFNLMLLNISNAYSQEIDDSFANPNQAEAEYFAASPQNQNKSIIYIFYNNSPCESCPQTIELIESIYDQEYTNLYNLFLINYQNDMENDFIAKYNLQQPLEIVLVQVNDGAEFGYKKLKYLENMISDPISFEEYFTNQVNTFLGNQ